MEANKINSPNKLVNIQEKRNQAKSRASKNWDKVRNIILKKSQTKTTKHHFIETAEEKIMMDSCQEIKEHLNKVSDKISGVIRSSNVIPGCEESIITFHPISKMKYLTEQQKQEEIDTTGSWVWDAEKILAYFISQSWSKFENAKSILELGAGSSGLAALVCAKKLSRQKSQDQRIVVVSDGKGENIPFLQLNILQNSYDKSIQTQSRQLQWGEESFVDKFELILAADCLFFQEFHIQLIRTLQMNLQIGGRAIFVNPSRGLSMQNFLIKLVNYPSDRFLFVYRFIEFENEGYRQRLKQAKEITPEGNHDYFFIQVTKHEKDDYQSQKTIAA